MSSKGDPDFCKELNFLKYEANERIERYKKEYPSYLRDRMKITPRTQKTLWIKQEGRCGICGKELQGKYGEDWGTKTVVDHIIAFKNGGWTEIDNLQLTHAQCNNDKRDHNTLEEILDYIQKKLAP